MSVVVVVSPPVSTVALTTPNAMIEATNANAANAKKARAGASGPFNSARAEVRSLDAFLAETAASFTASVAAVASAAPAGFAAPAAPAVDNSSFTSFNFSAVPSRVAAASLILLKPRVARCHQDNQDQTNGVITYVPVHCASPP